MNQKVTSALIWGEGFAAYAIADSLRSTEAISWPFAILLGCATSSFVVSCLQKAIFISPVVWKNLFAPSVHLESAVEKSVAVNFVVEKPVAEKSEEVEEVEEVGDTVILGRRRKLHYSFIDDCAVRDMTGEAVIACVKNRPRPKGWLSENDVLSDIKITKPILLFENDPVDRKPETFWVEATPDKLTPDALPKGHESEI